MSSVFSHSIIKAGSDDYYQLSVYNYFLCVYIGGHPLSVLKQIEKFLMAVAGMP